MSVHPTLDDIERHARERPRAPAVVHDEREITYEALARDVRRCARALQALGVSRGERVGVGCSNAYRHWLILLALEVLGAVNTSLTVTESEQGNALLDLCDRVLSEQAFGPAIAKKQFRLTQQWLTGVLSAGEDLPLSGLPERSEGDPVRISRTSATMGTQVLVMLDRRMSEARHRGWARLLSLDESARLLLALPMTATLTYNQANVCAQAGGTVILSQREGDALRAIQAGGVTHLLLLPWELARITDQLAARPKTRPVKNAFATGAAVSPALRDRTLERLADAFTDLYATNEVGFVSTGAALDPEEFGRLWPGVDVEAVDEQGRRVPDGQLGRVRIRAGSMATGYLGDARASAEFFKDGWFYPGDLGEMRGTDALRLLGRNIDVFNVGGIKVAADRVEEMARRLLGIRDLAACAIAGRHGIDEIWIAMAEPAGKEALRRARDELQRALRVRCHLIRVNAIPRNQTGKAARASIQRAILEQAPTGAGES